ncbi:MAG TPA: 4Fe-4S ferredoxin [Hungateiclostridium thermocellum]|uniref:Flavodoxin/nitric oxide synthase n=1 Tax=Acetivibrio thermocellus (strain ATCC 27405 / DSM 1237 / JCM 9322 / NBRC 103400 / NCIMB 10682 / NRRL B-4536 / VPI 7372) TaxID=203119 RepID=A3DJN6_ACET2|nr:EFR1 family ferrodoxin [Acetivibrio thermocellus]CDG37456.1 4Fe-4S ferredoxin, iron-sulfur binding [Acetivibrio thermocellus BC1]ABN54165.1 flavodoxin/nitric oxide synthase [Acetivibrio thermocellus ATCC 27405]NLU27418.1 4Fe-4S ferredoxin [Acetivibrio thermocellus]UWV47429.1 EFR1 family ferrodoxin [Acetivibrio thermocellus]HBW27750.1 4Fe-4S ferredoxin [Acetivibrio thermocellus]
MKGCIIYFSGTGNTEYVARAIKQEFANSNILCDTYEVSKNSGFEDKYDFYVFGAPIYAEMFPPFYTEWVKKHLTKGNGRKCIVFSTQANTIACGPACLAKELKRIGFKIVIEDCIVMPNNYYIVAFKKFTEEQVNVALKKAKEQAKTIVDNFLNGKTYFTNVKGREIWAKPVFKLFMLWSRKWAKKNLVADMCKCTRCGLCQKQCPVNNIKVDKDSITFFENCVSCQRCVHRCPANAFLYKNKVIEQYRLPKEGHLGKI